MRKPPVFAVEKQKPRQCLCLWRKHKSDGMKQKNVLKNKNYKIEEAYILSEGNIEIEGKRVYMPIYMIMFLENTELTNTIYKIDLDGLGE